MSTRHWMAAALAALLLVALAGCRNGRSSDGGRTGGAGPDVNPADQSQATSETGSLPQDTPTESPQDQDTQPTAEQASEATVAPVPTEPPPTATPEPTQQLPEPAPTEQPAEVVFEAKGGSAESLEDAWRQAYELPPGVPFSVTTTEAEIEAIIDQRMASSEYGNKISNLHVKLDNGQITVSFTLTVNQKVGPKSVDISGDGSVVFAASIDSSGHLALAVVSADFGKISVPPELLAPLSEAISQTITGAAAGSDVAVTLTSLVIDNGVMTVKGYVTPN